MGRYMNTAPLSTSDGHHESRGTPITWRYDVGAMISCMGLGLLLAVLPHLVEWVRSGELVWVADFDDFSVYLPLASRAFHHDPFRLDDTVVPEAGRSYYSSLALCPGIVVARGLGLGPLDINLVWRGLGGLVIGLMWYLLLRVLVRSPLYAAGLAALLLADGGVVAGQLFYFQGRNLARLATQPPSQPFPGPLAFMPQWRIVNPVLSWPWYFLFVWLLARAGRQPNAVRVVLAGIAFGLLFHVYFYYWTAAGLGLLLALVLDWRSWQRYLAVGVIGLLVGAPALWANLQYRETFGSDWMLRCDKFLPIGHFEELLIPRVTVAILLLAFVWVWRARRDLIFPWCLAAAAVLLLNQQVVTGLQIENAHWNYALGPALALLCVLLVVGWCQRRSAWPMAVRAVFWTALSLYLLGGVWLRTAEAYRFTEPGHITEAIRHFRAQRSLETAPPRTAGAVVAGDPFFVESAVILEDLRPLSGYAVEVSATVTTPEWDARVALNAYLSGLDRTRFREEQLAWLDRTVWGPWNRGRSAAAREERLASRLAAFDAIAANPAQALDRFAVRYLALPVGTPGGHLGSEWVQLDTGPHWQVWERRP